MAEPTIDQIVKVLDGSVTQNQPEGEFEIGLVLGGTVAAGAYTAGFLDKLIEVLDAWQLAKEAGDDVPKHDVKIRVATGASGGGVCAAILARALAFGFPHISPTSNPSDWEKSPFYAPWVDSLDVSGFLDTTDLRDGEPLKSVLNGDIISAATKRAAEFTGGPLPNPNWTHRPYVDNPFHIIVTLANLRGVLYEVDFGPAGKQSYLTHGDHARFACDVTRFNDLPVPNDLRPDTFFVQANGPDPAVNWLTLAGFARGSAAFPLGFPPSSLRRPRRHYDYRVVAIPGANGKTDVKALKPQWAGTGVGDEYNFLCVDGGTFNNEPLELARTFLSGVTGRNPRDRKEATRAIVLIDPLPSSSELGGERFESLLSLGGSILASLINQGRYSTADLMLMADPDVFSRFLAVPERGSIKGDKAIATAGLAAFMGFFEKEFRRHDYMLGRANCLSFLQKEFALDERNKLFKGRWSAAQKTKYGSAAGQGFLPVIPLVGKAAWADGPMPWPTDKLTAKQIRKRLKPRFERIVEKVADDAINFPFSDIPIALLKGVVADQLLNPIERLAEKNLRDWKL